MLADRLDLNEPVIASMSAVQTTVNVEMTVGEAIRELRSRRIEHPILYVYVVDADDRLVGVAPTRALLLGDPHTAIRDVMRTRVISIRADETVGDALLAFAAYRLLALPVVDTDGRLLGAVDVQIYADDTFELAEAQRVNQLFQMIGVSVREARDRSPWRGFRSRMPWLFWNIGGGTACAVIGHLFGATLDQYLILALFIPLVLTLAESVAMQSMTLVLEVLQGADIRWRLVRRRLRVEASTALLLGLCSGMIVGGLSLFFGSGITVACVFLGAILLSMVVAATIGAAIPVTLHAVRLDPTIAAGPLALTCADISATAIYLIGATIILM